MVLGRNGAQQLVFIHGVNQVLYKVVPSPPPHSQPNKGYCAIETAEHTSWERGIQQTETHNKRYEQTLQVFAPLRGSWEANLASCAEQATDEAAEARNVLVLLSLKSVLNLVTSNFLLHLQCPKRLLFLSRP